MLPIQADDQGNLIFEHWADVHEKYTTRLGEDGTWFEVRELNEDDPTGMARRFEGDWPKMFPLGPPSKTPDYNPILEKYGLKVLNAAGFINSTKSCDDMTLGPIGRLQTAFWRNMACDHQERMHPVFRFEMWRGITQDDYEVLRPSLTLASAVLDDPAVLNYFYALMQPADSMDTVVDPDTNMTCKVVDIPDTLTDEQQYVTYAAICAMRDYTSFNQWSSADGNYTNYAVTDTLFDQNLSNLTAARPNTRRTAIKIDDNYIKLIKVTRGQTEPNHHDRGNWFSTVQRMSNIPAAKREHIDLTSSHFRVTLFLATSILHEFTHAFINAYFAIDNIFTEPREPWVRGTRCNEQGYFFETMLFGGLPRAMIISHPPMSHLFEFQQSLAAPFGAYFTSHWDQWLHSPNDHSHVMPSVNADLTDQARRMYPIAQEWFQRIFGDDMWVDRVQRFGIEAIKMPKLGLWVVLAWNRGQRGVWGTGEERWGRPDDVGFVEGNQNWV